MLPDGFTETWEVIEVRHEYERYSFAFLVTRNESGGVERLQPWTIPFQSDIYAQRFADNMNAFAEQEAERDKAAWEADMKDMEQIRREWEAYRHQGDETPPTQALH